MAKLKKRNNGVIFLIAIIAVLFIFGGQKKEAVYTGSSLSYLEGKCVDLGGGKIYKDSYNIYCLVTGTSSVSSCGSGFVFYENCGGGSSSGPVCGNGNCETGETSTSCPSDCGASSTSCSDSDGGYQPDTKGTVTYTSQKTDYCIDDDKLIEYRCGTSGNTVSCGGLCSYNTVSCSAFHSNNPNYACVNGACIQTGEPVTYLYDYACGSYVSTSLIADVIYERRNDSSNWISIYNCGSNGDKCDHSPLSLVNRITSLSTIDSTFCSPCDTYKYVCNINDKKISLTQCDTYLGTQAQCDTGYECRITSKTFNSEQSISYLKSQFCEIIVPTSYDYFCDTIGQIRVQPNVGALENLGGCNEGFVCTGDSFTRNERLTKDQIMSELCTTSNSLYHSVCQDNACTIVECSLSCADGCTSDADCGAVCEPDNSCANSYCEDTSCTDECGNTYSGMLSASCPSPDTITCGTAITSTNSCEGCNGFGSKCSEGQVCSIPTTSESTCVNEDTLPVYVTEFVATGEVNIGSTKSVSAKFNFNEDYIGLVVEAQIVPVDSPKKSFDVSINRCDPTDHPLYRNDKIDVTAGSSEVVSFIFTPPEAGWYDVYVDAKSDCGVNEYILARTFIGSFNIKDPNAEPIDNTAACLESIGCAEDGACKYDSKKKKCVSVCAPWDKWDSDEFVEGEKSSGCVFNYIVVILAGIILILPKLLRQLGQ